MNIAIQTDEELILFYTSSIERAEEVCKKGNIELIDMFEVKDRDLQYYCFSSRLWDKKESVA